MFRFAAGIIKAILIINILFWILNLISGIYLLSQLSHHSHDYEDELAAGISCTTVASVFLLISSVYTYFIWKRIPFAAALLVKYF